MPVQEAKLAVNEASVPLRRITPQGSHHFFGYYDKFAVDRSGTRALTLEVDFMDRRPTAEDAARIGVVDLTRDDSSLEVVGETYAWCWQQACMLQWLPPDFDSRIIYNVREGDHFESRIFDLHTGGCQAFERPIYCVSPDGRFALSTNFARLAVTRPGYGYEGVDDPQIEDPAPEDDGVFRLDLDTGKSRLLFSLREIAEIEWADNPLQHRHWFNHLLVSPDSQRFIFLHRFDRPAPEMAMRTTRMFTANADGSGLHLLNGDEMTSHFFWRDSQTIIAWANINGRGKHYYLFIDGTRDVEVIAPDRLTADGHMSYAPQGRWFVTDTYPKEKEGDPPFRVLMLYDERDDVLLELGRFRSARPADGTLRCDPHARWSPDGRHITFDSIHEGSRQVYMMDVSGISDL